MSEREQERQDFLARHDLAAAERLPLAGDASARRYERLVTVEKTFVLMDAPPPDDVRPFIRVAQELSRRDYSPPAIHAADAARGFLLLEDLGDDLFAKLMAAGAAEAPLYRLAVDFLIDLTHEAPPADLPEFSDDYIRDQNRMFLEYYVPARTGKQLEADAFKFYRDIWETLLPHIRVGPEVIVMRDFHSENLLHLPEREGLRALGLLDFQDALRGPCAYDLVSLLQDARRDITADTDALIRHYLDRTGLEAAEFLRAYAILGAHRSLRILGIFTRLAEDPSKRRYLDLIPRMQDHLARNLAHPALLALNNWLSMTIGEGKS